MATWTAGAGPFVGLGVLTIETGGLGTYSLSPFTSSTEIRPPLHVL